MNPDSSKNGSEKWLSMSEASGLVPYSSEYLSLLARKGKLSSKKIDNTWYTTKQALDDYMKRQMLRAQVQNGSLPVADASLRAQGEAEEFKPLRSLHEDIEEYMRKSGIVLTVPERDKPVLPPVKRTEPFIDASKNIPLAQPRVEKKFDIRETVAEVEKVFEKVLDKKIAKAPEKKPSQFHPRHIFSSSALVVLLILAIASFVIFPVPIVFSFFERSFTVVKEAFSDANTVMGMRPGTHANELLILDEEGNIAIMGHVETEGQLRSYAADGIAPIVVDSMTMVENLNAQYLGGASSTDFTLAFVTRNGAVTTENVRLEGEVAVGKTLRVHGATQLLSTLSVGGELKVFGDAEFGQALRVLGPAYFEGILTAKDDLLVSGNIEGDKNIFIRGSLEAGRSVTAQSGSFDRLSAGDFSASDASVSILDAVTATIASLVSESITTGALTATDATVTNITSTNSTSTNLYADIANFGSINGGTIILSDLDFTNATGTSATTTNLFSTNARFTNLTADDIDFTDLTFTNATGTSATTTNFFSTTGTFSNLFSDTLNLTDLIFVNATGTNATTTSLFVSGLASTTDLRANAGLFGNVGIGVTSPTGLLQLGSGASIGSFATPAFQIGGTSNGFYTDTSRLIAKGQGVASALFDSSGIRGNGGTAVRIMTQITGTDTVPVFVPNESSQTTGIGGAAGTLSLIASGVSQVKVDSTGLLVNGSTTLQNFTFTNATGTAATTTSLFVSGLASTTELRANAGLFGNVGIGTTTPQYPLTVAGITYLGGPIIMRPTAAASGGAWIDFDANPGNPIYDTTSYLFRFSRNGAIQMSLKTSGALEGSNPALNNVGGTGSGARLQTAGATGVFVTNSSANDYTTAINALSSTKVGLTVNGAAGQSANLTEWRNSSGASLIAIDSTGMLGIATTSPFEKLSVAGNAYIGGNLTATGTLSILGASTFSSDLLVSGSTTLQNFTFTNATGTSATTTNFFTDVFRSALATITSIIADDITTDALTATDSTLTSAEITNSTTTNATTTNLYFSGLLRGGTGISLNASTGNVSATRLLTDVYQGADGNSFIALTGTNPNRTAVVGNLGILGMNFISKAGTGKFTFDNNVGIATTSPFEKLSVAGNAYIGGNLTATGTLSVLGGLTSLSNLLVTGSTTLQNFTFVNATGTSATTTNFFSTTGRFTDLFSDTLNLTDLIFVNATGTNATTTNLYVSGLASTTELRANTGLFGSSLSLGTTTPFARFAIDAVNSSSMAPFIVRSQQGTDYMDYQWKFLNQDTSANMQSAGMLVRGGGNNQAIPVFTVQNSVDMEDDFTIHGNGRVGIGTSTPDQLLQIAGASGTTGATPVTVKLTSTTNSALWTVDSVATQILFDSLDASGSVGTRGAIKSVVEDTGGSDFGLSFWTTTAGGSSPLERMRINHNGNVGIATTSPFEKLSVAGNAYIGGNLTATGTLSVLGGLTSLSNLLVTGSTTLQNFTFVNATGTSATTTNFFSTTGRFTDLFSDTFNVTDLVFTNATGTAATTTSFFSTTGSFNLINLAGNLAFDASDRSISRGGTNKLTFGATSLTVADDVVIADDNWLGLGSSAGHIEFDNQATDEVNILNANVGIGTPTPGTILDIIHSSATAYTSNGSLTRQGIRLGNDDNSGYTGMFFRSHLTGGAESAIVNLFEASNKGALAFTTETGTANNFAERMRITGDGFVGIGTTTPTVKFSVGGAAGDTTGHAYFTGGVGIGTVTTTPGALHTTGNAYIGGNLTIAGSAVSSATNGQFRFIANPAGTGVSEGTVYINPSTAGTNNVLLGLAVNGTEAARIDAEGDVQIIGTFNSTNLVGTNQLSGHLSVLGNTTIGNSSSDSLTVNSRVSSSIVPSADDAYDLGSPTNRWANFYAVNAFFDNVEVSNATTSAFIINSENDTDDTEDSTLEFSRGTATPNAILKWNSTDKRFEFNNFPVAFENSIIVSGTASSSIAGQLVLTGTPLGTNLYDGTLYINPSAGPTNNTLLGIGVAGVERLRVDAEGDTTIRGSLGIENTLYDITQDTLTIDDDLQVSGNDIKDSTGTTRITLGTTNTITGNLTSTGDITGTSLDVGSGIITSGLINGQTISSAANFTGTVTATGGLTTLSNLLLTGSTTLQNFTFGNATGTNATTTSLAITSLTAGSIPFVSTGGALVQDNAALFWDAANDRLGIGTASPTKPLTVKSTDARLIELDRTGQAGVDNTYSIGVSTGDNLFIGAGSNTGQLKLYEGGNFSLSSDAFFWDAGNTRLGIGTTTPGALLNLNSTVADAALFQLSRSDVTKGLRFINYNGTDSAFKLQRSSNLSTWTDMMSFDSNTGDVSIGASNPLARFHVEGADQSTTPLSLFKSTDDQIHAGQPIVQIENSGDTAVNSPSHILLNLVYSGDAGIEAGASFLAFKDSDSTLGRVEGDGNDLIISAETGDLILEPLSYVGIGTTSPFEKLSVAGNAYIGGNLTATGTLSILGSTSLTDLVFTNATGTNLFISGRASTTELRANLGLFGSNIGVGTTNPFTDFVTSSGDFTSSSGVHIKSPQAGILAVEGTTASIYLGDTNHLSNRSIVSWDANGDSSVFRGRGDDFTVLKDNILVINHRDGRVGINTATLSGDLNVGGGRVLMFEGGNGAIQAPSGSINIAANGTTQLSLTGSEIRANGASFAAGMSLSSLATNLRTMVIGKIASQTADLFEIQDDSGVPYLTVDSSGGFYASGSTTLQNFTFTNATGTSATTTNLFVSGLASTTNLRANTGLFGNVGIGLSSPSTALDINTGSDTLGLRLRGLDEVNDIADIYVGSLGQLTLSTENTAATAGYIQINPEDDQYGLVLRDSDTGNSSYANFYMNNADTDYLNINVQAANSTAGLVIQDGGNVGIGTTSPYRALSVAGNAIIDVSGSEPLHVSSRTFNQVARFLSTDDTAAIVVQDDDTTASWGVTGTNFGIQNGGASLSAPQFVINSSGNVGIGTTSPESLLTLQSTSPELLLKSTSANASVVIDRNDVGRRGYVEYRTGGAANWFTGLPDADSIGDGSEFYIGTNNIGSGAKLWIETSGDVGIGTTSPSSKLHVSNGSPGIISPGTTPTVWIEDDSTNYLGLFSPDANNSGIVFGSPTDGFGSLISWNHNADLLTIGTQNGGADVVIATGANSEAVRILDNGNLGIATTSPFEKLSVAGNAYIGGNLTATGTASISGAVTLSSTLNVAGVSTLTGNTTIGGDTGANTLTVTSTNNEAGIIISSDTTSSSGARNAYLSFKTDNTDKWMLGMDDSDSDSFKISSGSALGTNDYLTVTSAGNIGIGTSTPLKKLHILAGNVDGIRLESTISPLFDFFTQSANADARNYSLRTNYSANGTFQLTRSTTNTGDPTTTVLSSNKDGLVGINTTASQTSRLSVGGNAAIGSTYSVAAGGAPSDGLAVQGSVGIGTTSPATKLSVDGRITTSGSTVAGHGLVINRTDSTGGGDWRILQFGGGALSFQYNSDSSSAAAMVIDTSANVGIGTTTPWGKLSVTNTGTGPSFVVEDSASPDSTPFIIDASGNVGIGTASPTGLLHLGSGSGDGTIATGIGFGSDATAFVTRDNGIGGIRIGGNLVTLGATNLFGSGQGAATVDLYQSGTGLIRDSGTGSLGLRVGSNIVTTFTTGLNVGIGTTSPFEKLSVAGNAYIGGNLTATGTLSVLGDTNIENLAFTNATGTSATTTNFFTDIFRSTLATITSIIADDITTDALTATDSTLTNATSTNLFSTTVSSTNLFSTSGNIGTLTAGPITSGAITATGNSTVTGTLTGLTGLTSSGNITFSGLTATRAVCTTTGGQLTVSCTSAGLASSLSNETGSGVVVFGTSPAFTTSVTTASATFALFNTGATTINFGGAATTLNMGAAGGVVNVAGNLVVVGNSTTTSATTTNLFSTNATFTNLTADSQFIDDFIFTNATGTNATTTNLAVSGLTKGSIPFVGTGGAIIQDNSALFWDQANDRLGIGTNEPLHALVVNDASAGTDVGDGVVIRAQGANGLNTRSEIGFTYSGSPGAIAPVIIGYQNLANSGFTKGSFYIATRDATTDTTPTTRFTVTPAGNVGVGDESPTNTLDVAGTIGVGDTQIVDASRNLTNIGTITSGALTVTGNSTITGTLTGLTGLTSSGNINFSGLTASRLVSTDGSKNLVSGISVDDLRSSVTGTTGTGNLVFATSPTLTTLTVSSGGIAVTGDSTISGTLGGITNLTLSGSISGGTTITGTTLNGITGINTGGGAGTQRIDASGNLVNIGTITSGLINGQTISSTANFTGTVNVATSLTSPIVYGGTAAGSDLTLAGTSNGSPSGAHILLNTTNQGNVGIGVADPLSALHVEISKTGTSVGDGLAARIQSGNGANTRSELGFSYYGNPGTHTPVLLGYQNTTNSGFTNGSFYVATREVTTDTAPTQRLTVTSTGNVGIATTSPTERLSVGGNLYVGGNITATGTLSVLQGLSTLSNLLVTGSSTLQNFSGQTGTLSNGLLVSAGGIDSTLSTSRLLQSANGMRLLRSDAGATIELHQNTATVQNNQIGLIEFYGLGSGAIDADAGARVYAVAEETFDVLGRGAVRLVFDTRPTGTVDGAVERMTLNSSGNLGIATSSPFSKLSVAGSAYIGGNLTATGTLAVAGNTTLSGTLTATGGLSTLSNLLVTGSSTLQNFTFTNATGTSATTTSLFVSGLASTTNLRANTGLFGNVGIGTSNPQALLNVFTDVSGEGILVNSTTATVPVIDIGSARGANADVFLGQLRGFWDGGEVAKIVFRTGDDTTNKDDGRISFFTALQSSSPAERMRIEPNGNIGIGTSSPLALLDIKSTTATTHDALRLDWEHLNLTTDIEQRITSYFGDNATTDVSNQAGYIGFGKERSWSTLGNNDAYLAFGTGADNVASEKMRITSDGNVGIGTTTPASLLDISTQSGSNPTFQLSDGDISHGMTGVLPNNALFHIRNWASGDGGPRLIGVTDAITVAPGLTLQGINGVTDPTDTTPAVLINGSKKNTTSEQALGSLETVFQVETGSVGSGTKLLTILGSGNVGIGTTSPWGKLSVDNTGTSDSFVVNDQAADPSPFVIDASGNVGVGTIAPNSKLHVVGDIFIPNGQYLRGGTSLSVDNQILMYNGGTGDMEIELHSTAWYVRNNANMTVAGRFGIGTSTPSYKLSVSGSGFFDGGTVYTSSLVATSTVTTPSLTATNLLANGSSTLQNFTAQSGTLANLLVNGSSTLQNLTFTNATGTSATTTSLFVSGLASTTNLRANTGLFGNVGIGTSSAAVKFSVGGAAGDTSGHGYFTGGIGIGGINTTAGTLLTTGNITVGGSGSIAGSLSINQTNSNALFFGGPNSIEVNDSGQIFSSRPAIRFYPNNSSASQLRVEASGVTIPGTLTSGLINGQTISSASNFTGTLGVTGLTTATGGLKIDGGTSAAGVLSKSATTGLQIRGITGSAYDLELTNSSGNTIMAAPTGTANATFFGNVGIGTSTPNQLLQVVGASGVASNTPVTIDIRSTTNSNSWEIGAAQGRLTFSSLDTAILGVGASIDSVAESTAGGRIGLSFNTYGSALAEGMRLDFQGKLGIGTSTPSVRLTVAGLNNSGNLAATAVNTSMRILNTGTTNDNYSNTDFATLNTSGVEVATSKIAGVHTNHSPGSEAGNLVFLTASSGVLGERMRVLANGNVGIGTTTPGALLDVQGAAQFGTTNVDLVDSVGKIAGLSSTYFNADTSANLATILSDETGSGGGFVRATSPTLTTLTVSSGGAAITGNSTITGTLAVTSTMTEAGSAVISAADIDTCAEFVALVVSTGTCGSAVFSVSPTLTGTLTAATANFSGVLTANSTLDANAVVTLGDNGDNITIDSNIWDITAAGVGSGFTGFTTTGTLDAVAGDFSSTLTMSGTAANIALGSNYLSGDGGDEGIFIDSTGNVGIGTSTPQSRLHVQGSNTGNVMIGELAGSATYGAISMNGSLAAGNYNFASGPADNNLYINRPTGLAINFRENNTDQMTITTGGNVGIGTVAPESLGDLTVAGAEGASGGIAFWADEGDDNADKWLLYAGSDGKFYFGDKSSGSYDSNMIIDGSTGNVGIGAAAPKEKLDLAGDLGTTGGNIILGTYSGTASRYLGVGSGVAGSFGASSGFSGVEFGPPSGTGEGYLAFHTHDHGVGSGERMRIDKSGNVAIGSTDPGASKLAVAGDVSLTGNFLPNASPTITSTTANASTTVDSSGDVGRYPAMILGVDGLPVIAYVYESGAGSGVYYLRVTKCGNVACSSGNTTTNVDATGINIQDVSIAMGSDGYPVISYYDVTNGDLEFIKCGNAACSSGNTLRTIASTDSVGQYNDIAVGVDGNPVISYTKSGVTALRVAHCSDASCSSTTITNLHTGGGYTQTSVVINVNGFPTVFVGDGGAITAYKCTTKTCSTSSSSSLASGAHQYVTATIAEDGLPIVTGYYTAGATIMLYKCTTNDCGLVTGVTIGGTGYSSIAIGTDGIPVIAYSNSAGSSLIVVKCTVSNCAGGGGLSTTVEVFSAKYANAIINTDGMPVLASFDETNDNLVVTTCATNSCKSTPGGYFTGGSNIGSLEKFFNNVYSESIWAKQVSIKNFDVAENYKGVEGLEAGDVVGFLPGENKLTKATDPGAVLGIISTSPAITLRDFGNNSVSALEDKEYPVGLVGRVPVKVTGENGSIKVGDYLTVSSKVPGHATKATSTGMVIGKALENFNAAGTNTTGKIEVFLVHTYYSPDIETRLTNLNVEFRLHASTTVATLASITSAIGLNLASSSEGLKIEKETLMFGGLKVDHIASISDLIYLDSDVEFIGRPYFNSDMGGLAVIEKGDRRVDVVFDRAYMGAPVVSATISLSASSSDAEIESIFSSQVDFAVVNRSENGFSIILSEAAPETMTFSWMALAIRDIKIASSVDADQPASQIINEQTPTPNEEPIVESDTTSTTTIEIVEDAPVAPASTSTTETIEAEPETAATPTSSTAEPELEPTVPEVESAPSPVEEAPLPSEPETASEPASEPAA